MWVLLVNPTSGGGKGKRYADRVRSILLERKDEFIEVSGRNFQDAATKFNDVIKANSSRIDGVVVVGGDGMVHMAIQELAGTDMPMALVPAGTGNDFARSLNLNLKDPFSVLELTRNSRPVKTDLGKISDRYFADILSTGFDSIVNERANGMRFVKGRMKYNIAILLELSTFKPQTYRFQVDAIEFTTKAMLIAVSNGQSYGGGMRVTPDARVDDGLFDIMILGPVSKIEFLKVFPKVFSGQHVKHPAVKIMRGKKVTIESKAVAYADGERIGALPITAEIASGAIMTWRN